MSDAPPLDRAAGTLLGLACGDALGRPVEFRTPDAIANEHGHLDEMIGNGTHGQPAGTITDDTDMTLCLARSLASQRAFDPNDIAARYGDWLDSGPFDVGLMTRDAIDELTRGASPKRAGKTVWARRDEGSNAGNGSLMRCAPLALAFHANRTTLAEASRAESRITHYDPRCQWACVYLNRLISGHLAGEGVPLQAAFDAISETAPRDLVDAMTGVPDRLSESMLSNSGYVVDTLRASVYHAETADAFEDAVVNAVTMGGDADTLGAVTGAVAGSRFGASAIPRRWLNELDCASELRDLADTLTTTDIHYREDPLR